MKRVHSTEEVVSEESLIFQSSGWLNPSSSAESANENALEPPQTSATVTGLEPFTEYEFRVLAVNMAGSVSSAWVSEKTGEAGNSWCFDSTTKLMNQSAALEESQKCWKYILRIQNDTLT